jgi:hypothetical protein
MEPGGGQAAAGGTLGCRQWGKGKGAGDSTFYGVWENQPREVPVEVKTSGTPTVQAAENPNPPLMWLIKGDQTLQMFKFKWAQVDPKMCLYKVICTIACL